MFELRDYQQGAVNAVRAEFQAGRRAPLLVAPTGAGKTVMFAYIAQAASSRGNGVLILVHRKELLMQTSRTLRSLGVEHGLIAPGMTFTRSAVQVASVQTLVRRMDMIRWAPGLIIVDEAHHATGKSTWGKVLEYYTEAKVLGVTATPERLDGRGLGMESDGFFDSLVMGPPVAELVSRGFLSPPVLFAPGTVDLSSTHTRMGDFVRNEAEAAVDKPTITGNAVSHYKRHCHQEPAIAFCVSVAHAEHVAAEFSQAGYQAASIDGKLDDRDRKARIEDLGNGKLHVLTSCDIISEGTDIPVVSAAILLRPTQSLGLYLQQVGRALRVYPGKERALILDHVGNCLRHGLPDDERDWTLEGKKRSGKQASEASVAIRQCEECFHVHRPAPVCPKCGYRYQAQAREVEEVAGELQQVDPEELRRSMKREQAKAESLDDLREIARKRGYNERWAEYVWKARGNKVRRAAA